MKCALLYISPVYCSIWFNASRLRQGVIVSLMRDSRAGYHAQVRILIKQQEDDRRTRFAEPPESSTSATFLRKMHKFDAHQKLPSVVDGVSNQTNIANAFKTDFDNLFTCLSNGTKDIDSARETVKRHISSSPGLRLHHKKCAPACVRINRMVAMSYVRQHFSVIQQL